MIPVNRPLVGTNEKRYLTECVDGGWFSSEGPFVKRFEGEFARQVGRTHGIAVSSGSAALDIAVAALGLGPGDEVIMPTFTIISCAQAVVRAGATPVLLDCDPDSWNINADLIEQKITKKTKAIMAVHLYGLTTNMEKVCALAERHGLFLIEDTAQSIGQFCGGRPCGGFGDISVFSFYANKNITTGEGGMLVTNNAALAERSRTLRNLCFEEGKRFVHQELGWNYRITNLQAAVGCAQLEQLHANLIRKKEIGRRYSVLLADLPVQQPLPHSPWTENTYWVYGLVLPEEHDLDGAAAGGYLAAKGISTRPFFWPMHEQPVFQKMGLFSGQKLPVAERLARRGFYLPSGLGITDNEIEMVAHAVREILQ